MNHRLLHRLQAGRESERGAALILAVGFVLMVGAISAGLLAFITTSVGHRPQLDAVRDRQYAADGAVEYAIAAVRATTDPDGPGIAPCAPSSPGYRDYTVDGIHIRVDCQNVRTTVTNGNLPFDQRDVIFVACAYSPTTSCSDANANVIVRAQVNFERTATGAVTATYVQSWSVNR